MTETSDAGKSPAGSLLKAFPHLRDRGVSKETECFIYREFKPRQDCIEYTILFRVPGQARWRIDAVIDAETLAGLEDPEDAVMKNWTVTYMGPAIAHFMSAEEEEILRSKRLDNLNLLIQG